jgi:helix-turn-helix protein
MQLLQVNALMKNKKPRVSKLEDNNASKKLDMEVNKQHQEPLSTNHTVSNSSSTTISTRLVALDG